MAIVAAPMSHLAGGSYSTGPAKGQFRTVVNDAQLGESSKGRPQAVLEFVIKGDPNNPSKEGKKLKMWQSFPIPTDDHDKQESMRGMIKRTLYDGFDKKWPEKPVDEAGMVKYLKELVGAPAYVAVGDTKGPNGEARTGIIAVAQSLEKLPVPKSTRPDGANGTKTPPTRGRR